MSLSQIFKDFDDGHEEEPDDSAASSDLKAGDVIGNYKLVAPLGEGGFGAVWKAAQEIPIRREVALKILKLGMDSKEVLARFAQERQAMAVMDHPNIAMVFDAGTTPAGRPFVAMELITDGIPVTDYSSQRALRLPEADHDFHPDCSAIQHAPVARTTRR